MKVMHRVIFNSGDRIEKVLLAAGFKTKDGFNAIDVAEDHPSWNKIETALTKYDKFDYQHTTTFTNGEIASAAFFRVLPTWHHAYPEPSDDFGYFETTYTPGVGCRTCGVGVEQQQSFAIKKAPKWGRRNITQLNWVFGEYFVSQGLKEILQQKMPELNYREVLKYRSGAILEDIHQIVIEKRVNVAIAANAKFEVCAECGQKKHLPHTRGFFPMPRDETITIAQSVEYFGSGGSAFQEVIISRPVYELFNTVGIKGIEYWPCG